MSKFFNSAEKHRIEREQRKARREALRKELLEQLEPQIEKIVELQAITKLYEAKSNTVVTEAQLKKMYEPDKIELLVKALHMKFLAKDKA